MPTYSLGRVKEHDPRSLRYAHGVIPRKAIQSVRWTRRTKVFNQGNVGSCTGQAAAGLIVTDSLGRTGTTQVTITDEQAAKTKGVFKAGTYTVDETFSDLCYQLNTRLDTFSGTYKPNDTGSSGLAAAKTLQALGLADVYTHGFSLSALDTALQKGPVMAGTVWYESMFEPDSDGVLNVSEASGEAGGHEYVVVGLNVETGLYEIDNSWDEDWGKDGSAFIPKDSMQLLLDRDGDVTVPHLLGTDAPVPVPTPAPAADADTALAQAMHTWLTAKSL